MAKNTARPLGHEVDVDRDKFTYLASTDANGDEIKSGSAAATAVGAGAAAEETASDYEPETHVVAGADEEHVGAAAEQPDLQEQLDENNADYEPSQHVVGEAEQEHIGTAPEEPNQEADGDLDDLKDKAAEAGNAVEEAINRAKDFVEDKAQEYQEGSGKKGGFFDRVKDVVREARDNLEEKRK